MLKRISWKLASGLSAVIAIMATIGILQLVSINPKKKTIEKQIVTIADRDTTIVLKQRQIESLQALTLSLREKSKNDSTFSASQIRQLQTLIRGQQSELKGKEDLITKLETGVRVDLVTLTVRKRFIGSDQLIDSTYQKGWKYGELQP